MWLCTRVELGEERSLVWLCKRVELGRKRNQSRKSRSRVELGEERSLVWRAKGEERSALSWVELGERSLVWLCTRVELGRKRNQSRKSRSRAELEER